MEAMPFRDASPFIGDHGVSIQVSTLVEGALRGPHLPQDCLYGIHKALEIGLLNFTTFDKIGYRHYEEVPCVRRGTR